MYRGNEFRQIIFGFALSILLVLACAVGSWAADVVTENVKKIQMVVGKSIVLKIDGLAKRVSIASPEVADFVLVSPHEVYVTAKAAGVTNLTIWQDKRSSTTSFPRKRNCEFWRPTIRSHLQAGFPARRINLKY
jgi:Flp pilus assembly secretin CpaC